jgi:DNA-binding phage protein
MAKVIDGIEYDAETVASVREDLLAEVAETAEDLADSRRSLAEAEAELHVRIRRAIEHGCSPTKIARAAQLSRERIYQIRDGRR